MPLWTWSRTSADANGSADPGINFLENQAPSSLNDSARALMLATAQYRDDTAGGTVTSGASQAYALSTFSNFTSASALANQLVAFTVHATNGAGPVTMSVDSIANIPLRSSPDTELLAGVLVQGTSYCAVFNRADNALYLQSFYGPSPFLVPLGGLIDYIGGITSPNSSFAVPNGQAISRTTYATLFALIGTTYGAGDGSTTFNLPDMTGRVAAMREASPSRLTSGGFGGDSTTLGATGGLETETLTAAQIPAHTHPNTLSDPGHSHTYVRPNYAAGQIGGGGTPGSTNGTAVQTDATLTGITIANAANTGGGGAHPNVQPTIIVNKLLRIL